MSNQSDTMNTEESEKSFFNLCELDRLQVGEYTVEHNLNKWNLYIYDSKVLPNKKISIEISVPYTEMNLSIEEKMADPEFFGKNTARLTISNKISKDSGMMSYLMGKTVKVTFSNEIQCLLFDTPYFYPHNTYYLTNKGYLYKKISYSVNFMNYFIEAYRKTFQGGIPLLYVKETRETRDYYELDLILKEYLTISYVKTDLSTATIYFHMLLESDKKSNADKNQVAKYHAITVTIPREIRSGQTYFKFTANVI